VVFLAKLPGNTTIYSIANADPEVLKDFVSSLLNEYFDEISKNRIVPLVQAALAAGHRIIIFSNNPLNVRYSTKIDPTLQQLCDEGKAELFYHSDEHDAVWFNRYLKARGIKNLIYIGFSSNVCVIGRSVGMITMREHAKLYFVPNASAAIERAGGWESGEIHGATTFTISQYIGELLDYGRLMDALGKVSGAIKD